MTHGSTSLQRKALFHLHKPFLLLDAGRDNGVTHATKITQTQSWVKECRHTAELCVSLGFIPLGQLRFEPSDGGRRRMQHTPESRIQPVVPSSYTHTNTQRHAHSWARTSRAHSWAHVYTSSTDADLWERWGCAPRTFAHPTHRSTFHTNSRVAAPRECVLCYYPCLLLTRTLVSSFLKS